MMFRLTAPVLRCCFILWLMMINGSHGRKDYDTLLREYDAFLAQNPRLTIKGSKSCINACVGQANRDANFGNEPQCYCDKKCEMFGDCCMNYWKGCTNGSTIYDSHVIYECMDSTLKISNTSDLKLETPQAYQVINKCPKDYANQETKTACEAPGNGVLLFVQGADHRDYRNEHCARCHGIVAWTAWETELRCPVAMEPPSINERLKARNFTFSKEERKKIRELCWIVMDPQKNTAAIRCNKRTTCKDTTNENYEPCLRYKYTMYHMSGIIAPRNPHCAKCENVHPFWLSQEGSEGGTGEGKSSLATLFDFSKASEIYGIQKKPKKVTTVCSDGQIYDFVKKECRKKKTVLKSQGLGNWTCPYHNETFANISSDVIMLQNHSVFVPSHNRSYTSDWYRWHGNNITVCGNLTTTFVAFVKDGKVDLYSMAEYYITLVGFSLSIFALLILLFTYAIFAELRTLPGKIVINLAVALLLSQAVFLYDIVEDVTGDVCRAIAIILHYLYIASFCWMNAMAFDVSRTFAGKSHRSPSGSRNKVFLFCLLYAWGVPMVIVGIALAVNHTGTLDVGYGNEYYCWLTNPVALAVCFAAPVVLMLLFNVVALIRVLVAVRRVRKATKKVRDQSATQDIGMCWKLTAVFGITWLLGLCAGYNFVIRIIYLVFNSLQGVFIMIGFIMTRRILNLYLKKAGKQPLSTRTSSQSRSTALTNTVVDRKRVGSNSASAPLVARSKPEPSKPRAKKSEGAADGVAGRAGDSAEAELIDSMEGPETRL